ncbi:alpha/beta fold hydrolase [Kitasatospora sp. NPDC098652]|uniref:alpha/beta fold hydrolase n=1 Tax=Kitasatospora sp. NPDC098652 TaxID=3364095 RepID=UPI00381AC3C2
MKPGGAGGSRGAGRASAGEDPAEPLRPAVGRLLANPALSAPREMIAPLMLAMRSYKPGSRPPARPFTDGELGSIGLPVLVLVGRRSALLRPRQVVERVTALVPGVRAEILERAGHGLNLEQPEAVNERLLAFVGAAPEPVAEPAPEPVAE